MTPACFRDSKQYSEWLHLARCAKETCTICEDCTVEYEDKMQSQGRCHKGWYSAQLVMRGKCLPLRPPECKVTKEIEHEKLYWDFLQVAQIGSDDQPLSSGIYQRGGSQPYAANP